MCFTASLVKLLTANGEVQVTKRLTVFLKLFGIEVSALVLDTCPNVLSLGRLIEEHGPTFIWIPGQAPTLSKGDCSVDLIVVHFVPFIDISALVQGNAFALPGVSQLAKADSKVAPKDSAVHGSAPASAEEKLGSSEVGIKLTAPAGADGMQRESEEIDASDIDGAGGHAQQQ